MDSDKSPSLEDKDLVHHDDNDERRPIIDETHPLVTKREMIGWYAYDGANSVFQALAIGGYMPTLVTDLAKYNAADSGDGCRATFGGVSMRPVAFASTFVSFSVLFQVVLFVTTSAMADYGVLRKRLMLSGAVLGGIFTVVFMAFYSPDLYWLGGIFIILSNLCYGYSVVFYNAYLPVLLRSHPDYVNVPPAERGTVWDKLSNKHSTIGYAVGYGCSVFLLIATFPIAYFYTGPEKGYYICDLGKEPEYVVSTDSTLAYRSILLITGCWWALASIVPGVLLHPRPGPDLPPGRSYIGVSLSNVMHTFRQVKKLPQTCLFLICYFFFSDGYNTVASVAVLFATTELKAQTITIAVLLISTPLCGLIGNLFFFWRMLGTTVKRMIMATLMIIFFIPAYGLIGFINGATIGVKYEWELYFLGPIYGFAVGAVQSSARSLFISLVPPGHESEFFGFFELTDKGSSWIGPLIVAAMTETLGTIRWSLIPLCLTILVPMIALAFLDVEKGTRQAKEFGAYLDRKVDEEKTGTDIGSPRL